MPKQNPDYVPNQPEQTWEERFDEKWKKVECSAHERTSSAHCICDELEDINADYGYKEIKSFISASIKELLKQVVPIIEKDFIDDDYEGYVECRKEVLDRINKILK